MNENNYVTNLLQNLGYNYKLGDIALIENFTDITTILDTLSKNKQLGADFACNDCSGDITDFQTIEDNIFSFYATDNNVEYQFKSKALVIITNDDESTTLSPSFFMFSDKISLPENARIENSTFPPTLKCAYGIITNDKDKFFDSELENKFYNIYNDPNSEPITFNRIKRFSYDGPLAYININTMDSVTAPLMKFGNLSVEELKNSTAVIKK